jgi:hypothetical protein
MPKPYLFWVTGTKCVHGPKETSCMGQELGSGEEIPFNYPAISCTYVQQLSCKSLILQSEGVAFELLGIAQRF